LPGRDAAWAAKINGADKTFTFKRYFLDRVRGFEEDPPSRADVSILVTGDILEVGKNRTRKYFQVVEKTDETIELVCLKAIEIARHFRGK